MDVFDRVMLLMLDNDFKPSNKQTMLYSQSETTVNLNKLPSFEYLKEKIGMEKEIYDKLEMRFCKYILN